MMTTIKSTMRFNVLTFPCRFSVVSLYSRVCLLCGQLNAVLLCQLHTLFLLMMAKDFNVLRAL